MNDDDLPPLNPETPQPLQRRSPVWVRVLLFFSLAANLLIIGLVVGTLLLRSAQSPDQNNAPRLRDVGLGPISAILSRDQRGALRESLRDHAPELRENREGMRKNAAALLDALRAEDFDPAAVALIFERQRGTQDSRLEIGHRVLIDVIGSATKTERAAMADRLERALRRGKPSRGSDRN